MAEILKTTCIICPVGCDLTIKKDGEKITVTGNACSRGITYGTSEITEPKRIVTSLIVGDKQICSVKTTKPIDKAKIFEVIKLLKKAPKKKYSQGEIVFKNIFGSDIIVTGVTKKE